MKQFLLLFCFAEFFNFSDAQKTELLLNFNSGLFSFGGKSPTSISEIIENSYFPDKGYTNNPYGTKPELSFGFSWGVQRVSRKKNIFGASIGYETLKSKVDINTISYNGINRSASGRTTLTSNFIYLYPYYGHRFFYKKLHLDFTAGLDIAFCTDSKENGSATDSNDNTVTAYSQREQPNPDVRLRAQLSLYYNHLGIYTGYSYGVTNFTPSMTGVGEENYARLFRFGIIYLISDTTKKSNHH